MADELEDAPTVPHVSVPGPTGQSNVAAPTPPASGPTFHARYVLGDRLGRGGMGEVLLATDLEIGREVAIKRLHPEITTPETEARFVREARVQGQLEHPAIVPVYALTTDEDGRWYFVMKRLAGVTLAEILARHAAGDVDTLAAYPRQRLLRVFTEVCLAIEFAHQRGVIHRDVKPANIMLGEFGEVYVLDWGIARVGPELHACGAQQDGALETVTGIAMGTSGYMAPEQIASAADVNPSADVYALGSVLFELLAGEPLHAHGQAGLVTAVMGIDGRPSRRRSSSAGRAGQRAEVPPELDAVCVRALALTASERPTARELASEIERYQNGDRDLALRRELAVQHLARAHTAMTSGDDEAARRTAMREAGRALALDPDASEAAAVVSRLMFESPRIAPRAVELELASDDAATVRSQSRLVGLQGLGYIAFIPLLAWIGVRDWRYIYALLGLALAAVGSSWWVALHPRRWNVVMAAVLQSVLLALVARMFTPFLVAPAIATVGMMVFASQPQVVPVRSICVLLALAIIGPALLEVLGVLSPTMQSIGSTLVLTPPALLVSSPAVEVVLSVNFLLVLINTAHLTTTLAASQRAARRSLKIQDWHLRQLVQPGEALRSAAPDCVEPGPRPTSSGSGRA